MTICQVQEPYVENCPYSMEPLAADVGNSVNVTMQPNVDKARRYLASHESATINSRLGITSDVV
jgi:hypothetical protein